MFSLKKFVLKACKPILCLQFILIIHHFYSKSNGKQPKACFNVVSAMGFLQKDVLGMEVTAVAKHKCRKATYKVWLTITTQFCAIYCCRGSIQQKNALIAPYATSKPVLVRFRSYAPSLRGFCSDTISHQ